MDEQKIAAKVAEIKRLDAEHGYRFPQYLLPLTTVRLEQDDYDGVRNTITNWCEADYDAVLKIAAECAYDETDDESLIIMADVVVDEALQEYGMFHPPAVPARFLHPRPPLTRLHSKLARLCPQMSQSILRFFCGDDPRIRGRIR